MSVAVTGDYDDNGDGNSDDVNKDGDSGNVGDDKGELDGDRYTILGADCCKAEVLVR